MREFLLTMFVAAFAWGQPAPAQEPLSPPRGETVLAAKRGCADLRSLTGYQFTVETAAVVAATADAPEHCRVRGQILPEIRFQVDLPSSWNRRFYMFGNGGFAGESQEQMSRGANLSLRRGFAVAFTNTGHEAAAEPLATFAQNRQKLLDYAFR
jgi:feruloyl esterase